MNRYGHEYGHVLSRDIIIEGGMEDEEREGHKTVSPKSIIYKNYL